MPSVTSYFKFTVFKKDLARSWPLWTVYTLLWVLFYPVLMLVDRGNSLRWQYVFDLERWTVEMPLSAIDSLGMVVLALLVGLVAAMVTFSYLFNARACQFAHALPARREGLFLSHWLAGVTMFAGSHLIVYGLTLVAQAACGSPRPGPLAALLGLLTLMCLFFFSFAVLCAALTGHILAMPALYIIFNFLVMGLYSLLSWMVSTFLFGLTGSSIIPEVVRKLTPVVGLSEGLYCSWESAAQGGGAAITQVRLEGVYVVWIYAAVGLLLSVIALLLYRRRHLEMAGEVISVGPLRPVFRYTFALCAALTGGCVLFAIFGLNNTATFIALMVLWGVVGYYIASMLLAKSFRVFHRWKGAVGVTAAVLVLSGVISSDVLGLEARVPDPADVESLTINGLSTYPYDGVHYLYSYPQITDPEDISLVVGLHQAVVDHRDELRNGLAGYSYDAEHDSISFMVTYKLKSGLTLRRSYDYFQISADGLSDPDSVEYALQSLMDDRSFLASIYSLDQAEGGRVTCVSLELYDERGAYRQTELYQEEYARESGVLENLYGIYGASEESEFRLEDEDLYVAVASGEVLDAVLGGVEDDFAAGRLGSRWLFESQKADHEDVLSGVTLRLEWERSERNEKGRLITRLHTTEINLSADAAATLTALAEAGAFPEGEAMSDASGRLVWDGTRLCVGG